MEIRAKEQRIARIRRTEPYPCPRRSQRSAHFQMTVVDHDIRSSTEQSPDAKIAVEATLGPIRSAQLRPQPRTLRELDRVPGSSIDKPGDYLIRDLYRRKSASHHSRVGQHDHCCPSSRRDADRSGIAGPACVVPEDPLVVTGLNHEAQPV